MAIVLPEDRIRTDLTREDVDLIMMMLRAQAEAAPWDVAFVEREEPDESGKWTLEIRFRPDDEPATTAAPNGTPASPGAQPAAVGSATVKPDDLGRLSRKFETGGRGPATVSTGQGDAGGVSYGSYQMTSRPAGGTVTRFVAQMRQDWRARFAGLVAGDSGFTAAWKTLANASADALWQTEHTFIKESHFDRLCNAIRTACQIDIPQRSRALQDVIWSTAVQHGPGSSVVQSAAGAVGANPATGTAYDRALIGAIYAERGRRDPDGGLHHFRRNSAAVQESVANRFVREQADALKMLDAGPG